MRIENINHINITGPEELINEVKDFYIKILKLAEGERPAISVKGYWLYAGRNAILHLVIDDRHCPVHGTYLDHIAFTVTGLTEAKRLLDSNHVPYKELFSDTRNQTQLFFLDPAGNGIELNFKGE